MRFYISLTCFFVLNSATAQFGDDFSDGDFISNPTWAGDTDEFVIDGGQLRSNGPDASEMLYLSTESTAISNATWEFSIELGFAPSSSNQVKIYLVSDQSDLESTLNGYFLEIGQSGNDHIRVYRQDGDTDTNIFTGTTEFSSSTINVRVRVTRDEAGLWEVFSDPSGGSSFASEGSSFTDATYTTSAFFGVVAIHTSTRKDLFYFDDFVVTGTAIVDSDPPTISSVVALSETEVQVTFSEAVDEASSESLTNYVFDNGITVTNAVRDDLDFEVVTLTTSDLLNGQNYLLTVNNVEDLNGNVIAVDSETSFQYLVFEDPNAFDVVINEFMPDPDPAIGLPGAEYVELYNKSAKYFDLENWMLDGQSLSSYTLAPNEYVIVVEDDDETLFSAFPNLIVVTSLSLNNSSEDEIILDDNAANEIFSIVYSGSDDGISFELINPDGPDYSIDNYGLSEDPDGGTPGEQNSIFDDTPDTTLPEIVSISAVSETEVSIEFSEKVTEASAELLTNYSIDNDIIVSAAVRDDTDRELVRLTVSALTSPTTYQVTINNVEDLSGNVIEVDSEGSFFYVVFEEAEQFDVLINEFMADPEPAIGLPEAEYVELYNGSAKYINLESWTLDGQVMSSYTLAPDSYVIVVDEEDEPLFTSFSNTISISFLGLNNAGDEVSLANDAGSIIHEIAYETSSDGISTELINPEGPDYSIDNYGLSEDPDGGTPGEQNSIFDDTPDNTLPEIVSISAVSETEIIIEFSEKVTEASAELLTNYSIDNGISISAAVRDDTDRELVRLTVSALTSPTTYQVTINNVADLSGNVIEADSEGSFFYVIFEEAEQFDVLINEFMADPEPAIGLPEAEYVELYNGSAKYINLVSWTLDGQVMSSYTLAPDSYVIVVDEEDEFLFTSFSNTISISFLGLSNAGDEVSLANDAGSIIHEIAYETSSDGISTELINPEGPDYSIDNYGLSDDPDGGTPGEQNSIFDDTPDTTLPEIVSISAVSETVISIEFSEKVMEASAELLTNYSIDNGIIVSAAVRDDTDRELVRLTVSALTSPTTYQVTINNVEDLSGNVIEADSEGSFFYVVFEEAEQFDVLINEFMADPEPAIGLPEAEYVELYNRSAKYINLESWTLDGQAMSSYTLAPDAYVVVVEEEDEFLFTSFSNTISISFLGLSNAGDEVSLANDAGSIIHEIAYETSSDGVSTELINPEGPDYSIDNYGLSDDPDGGTPGEQNSIFDDTPDTTLPEIVSISAVSETVISIEFSEKVTEASAGLLTNYSIDNGISISAAVRDDTDRELVRLTVSPLMSPTTYKLTINNVEDLSGNVIEADSEGSFFYVVFEEADEFDVLINEFMADPEPAIGLPEAEYVELYNRSTKYINLQNWTLDDRLLPSFTFAPDGYLIIVDDEKLSLFEDYSNVIGITSLGLNNSGGDQIILADSSAIIIHSILYENSVQGVSSELINPEGPDYSIDNYGLSEDPDGGTPGEQNSIFDDTPDTTLPEIVSISAVSETEIIIEFSEKVTEASAELLTNYSIDNGISISAAVRDDTDRELVRLTVSPLMSPTTYKLTINNVEDLSGNVIEADSESSFFYVVFEEAEQFDVLINEFMADPEPAIGLPEAEYVELYNRSTKYINLENWTLDGQAMSSYTLAPDSYVIVLDEEDESLFTSFSTVISISFLGLSNAGDEVSLANDAGSIIHEIEYETSSDGISAELINTDGPDYSIDNYGLSEDPDGGTPGEQNSIFDDTPDTTLPEIVSISAVSETEVSIEFSEKVTEASAELLTNYSIDNGISISAAVRDDTDRELVRLTVSPLTSPTTYQVTINNVADLSGNVIDADSEGSFFYVVFEEAEQFDVVINEFMADPEPAIGLPEAEYVELYNRSTKYINLQNWTIDDRLLPSFTFAPDGYLIIVDDEKLSLFEDYSNVIGITSLGLNNSGGDQIILADSSSIIIHSILYENSVQGVSSELINPEGPDYSIDNYGFSEDADGGTPGEQNSIFDDTPDTTLPEIVSISAVSETEIIIEFSEKVTEASAELLTNYSIDNGISISAAVRDDTDRELVRLTVSPLTSPTTYQVTINNVADLSGNVIDADSEGSFFYVVFEEAEQFDVVINEFMADPEPAIGLPEAEYVELYNSSEKYLDLHGWALDDRLLADAIMPPDTYIIVVDDEDEDLFSSFSNVVTVSSLNLNNTGEDEITLTSSAGSLIHSIFFNGSISGISTELINPNGPDFSAANFGPSENSSGGTPGAQNSIFDDTPDTFPPTIVGLEVLSATELVVSFRESLAVVSAETVANYNLDGGILVRSASLDPENGTLIQLMVDELTSLQLYTLTVNGVSDLSGNVAENVTIAFQYIATDDVAFGDVVINEFMADPTPASVLPEGDFIEILNISDKYLSTKGWTLSDDTNESDPFPSQILAPGEYLLLSAVSNVPEYQVFGSTIGVEGFPNLNEGGDAIVLRDSTQVIFAELFFDAALVEDATSAELVNPQDPCISESSYKLSASSGGATPGASNTVFDDSPDTEAPFIASFGYQNSLVISFSEKMEAASLSDIANYTSESLIVNQADVGEEFPREVSLGFLEEVIEGATYEITISGVADCWGNIISPTTIEFGLGRSPTFNELIVTEIFFDPTPSVGLPEREYVEVYNNTSDILSTEGIFFSDATSTVGLPSFNLQPGSYMALTSSSGVSEFPSNVVGISGFPSLNDSGELLALTNANGLIFSIQYDPDWHDEQKAEGGYALEMVDITNPCLESAANWRSSIDPKGGTPGEMNAIAEIIPDSFGPEIRRVVALSVDTIQVDFSEKVDPTLISTAEIDLNPEIPIREVYFDNRIPRSFFIILEGELLANQLIELSLSKIFDCAGNEITDAVFSFSLPLMAGEQEIKLSEVLFDPRSGGVDFVEVFNDSENYLSLKGWRLARLSDGLISQERVITEGELVLNPGEYLAFTSDVEVLLGDYPGGAVNRIFEMASLLGYNDSEGTVVLLNHLGEEMEQFAYNEDQHYDLLEDNEGVSLERISFAEPASNAANWRSASSTEGFATPGYANSQAVSSITQSAELVVEPKVFIPGNAGSGRDFTTINYQFKNGGQFANVNIYDQNGRLIRNLAQGALLSTSGFMRWDGETNSGAMARMGYYVVLFEVYDVDGNTEIIKETVVVGRDF